MSTLWPFADDWFAREYPEPAPAETADDRLAREVAERLCANSATRSQPITVTVQNRVVVLLGAVHTADVSRAAGDIAWAVPGIFDVCNALAVRGNRRR